MQIFYSFVILENMIVKHGKHMKTQLGKYLFVAHLIGIVFCSRSEERRVGKECRSRWSTYH